MLSYEILSMNIISHLALVACLSQSILAFDYSDVSPSLARSQADFALSKDYKFTILEDNTVRRTWQTDKGELSLDFDPRSDSLISVQLAYKNPVTLKEAGRDGRALSDTTDIKWRRAVASKVKHLGFSKALYSKLSNGSFIFVDYNSSEKITHLTIFSKSPKKGRRDLKQGDPGGHATALGVSEGNQRYNSLFADEERRHAMPLGNKGPKPSRPAIAVQDPDNDTDVDFGDELVTTPDKEEEQATGAAIMAKISEYWNQLTVYAKNMSQTDWMIAGGGFLVFIILCKLLFFRKKKKQPSLAKKDEKSKNDN